MGFFYKTLSDILSKQVVIAWEITQQIIVFQNWFQHVVKQKVRHTVK